jgi:hypothetical protein
VLEGDGDIETKPLKAALYPPRMQKGGSGSRHPVRPFRVGMTFLIERLMGSSPTVLALTAGIFHFPGCNSGSAAKPFGSGVKKEIGKIRGEKNQEDGRGNAQARTPALEEACKGVA